MQGDGLVEAGGDVAVGDEVRRRSGRHLDGGPHDDAGETVAPDGGPEQFGVLAGRSEMTDLAVGGQQVHAAHVVTEAASAVMVLAVDIAGDRPADGDLPGSRQHRDPQPERQGGFHQLVEVDPGVDVDQLGVGVNGVDSVQRRHVDHQPTAVLGVVPIGAAQPARDSTPAAPDSATRATALTIISASGVRSTFATDGAVRPHPVSRVAVVVAPTLNIVKEGTRPIRP